MASTSYVASFGIKLIQTCLSAFGVLTGKNSFALLKPEKSFHSLAPAAGLVAWLVKAYLTSRLNFAASVAMFVGIAQ